MTSLIFYTDSTQALVATDSLATNNVGEPFMFISKAGYIPHLRTIIAGTGAGGFANKWQLDASSRMIVRGIRNLDLHTSKALQELWKDYKVEYSLPDDFTTTVYQFGICEETGELVSFAYRSKNEFISEQIPYGTAVKPECKVVEGNLIELIPEMMKEQRDIQLTKPLNERVYIGGEIYAYHLNSNGCNCIKLGEFEEFREQEKQVFSNYDKNNKS